MSEPKKIEDELCDIIIPYVSRYYHRLSKSEYARIKEIIDEVMKEDSTDLEGLLMTVFDLQGELFEDLSPYLMLKSGDDYREVRWLILRALTKVASAERNAAIWPTHHSDGDI